MSPTIALSMIVRNEAQYIVKTLTFLLPYIDHYAISDTGSNDNTKDLITKLLKNHNKSFSLTSNKWIDFAYNRNIVLSTVLHKYDYILLIDADEHFIVYDTMFKQMLSTEKHINYRVSTKHSNIANNTASKRKLISGYLDWYYEDKVHEQLRCKTKYYKTILLKDDAIQIVHTRPTTNEKISYYKKLMEEILETKPNHYSTLYHYGNHLRQEKKYTQAISIYQHTINTNKLHITQLLNLRYYILLCKYHMNYEYSLVKEDLFFFINLQDTTYFILEPIYIGILILCKENNYVDAYHLGRKYYKKRIGRNVQCFNYYTLLYNGLFDKKIDELIQILHYTI